MNDAEPHAGKRSGRLSLHPRALERAGEELEQRLAVQAAELQRVNRFLRILRSHNRAIERVTHDLLHMLQKSHDVEGANQKSGKNALAELRSRYQTLTPREREVMTLVVEGLLNKQIASELGTAVVTVKIQRSKVMKKMKAKSVADLVRFAEKLKLKLSAGI